MTEEEILKLKYPIGRYRPNRTPDEDQLNQWIMDIERLPADLSEITSGLTIQQLNYQYRPEGWSIKQVVHHLADSHMNSFIRFKLALTEESPTIRPYLEDKWAKLTDGNIDDIVPSIQILTGLHVRWITLIKSLNYEDLQKVFVHPDHGRTMTLVETTGLYAWHSNHHKAHILQALEYRNKF